MRHIFGQILADFFSPLNLVGVALFLVGAIVSTLLAVRAMKLLSPEEERAFRERFSRTRLPLELPIYIFAGSICIGVLYPKLRWPAFFTALALALTFYVLNKRVLSRRYRELGINPAFQKAYDRSRWMFYFGLLALFILATLA